MKRRVLIILIIDHDPMSRALTALTLKPHGYSVIATSAATDALETFFAHHEDIALVVADPRLPDMTGPQLFDALGAIDPRVPVIARLTGDPLDQQLDLYDNVVDAIGAPCNADELLAHVRRALDAAEDVAAAATDEASIAPVAPLLPAPPPLPEPQPLEPPPSRSFSRALGLHIRASKPGSVFYAPPSGDRFEWPPRPEDLATIEVVDALTLQRVEVDTTFQLADVPIAPVIVAMPSRELADLDLDRHAFERHGLERHGLAHHVLDHHELQHHELRHHELQRHELPHHELQSHGEEAEEPARDLRSTRDRWQGWWHSVVTASAATARTSWQWADAIGDVIAMRSRAAGRTILQSARRVGEGALVVVRRVRTVATTSARTARRMGVQAGRVAVVRVGMLGVAAVQTARRIGVDGADVVATQVRTAAAATLQAAHGTGKAAVAGALRLHSAATMGARFGGGATAGSLTAMRAAGAVAIEAVRTATTEVARLGAATSHLTRTARRVSVDAAQAIAARIAATSKASALTSRQVAATTMSAIRWIRAATAATTTTATTTMRAIGGASVQLLRAVAMRIGLVYAAAMRTGRTAMGRIVHVLPVHARTARAATGRVGQRVSDRTAQAVVQLRAARERVVLPSMPPLPALPPLPLSVPQRWGAAAAAALVGVTVTAVIDSPETLQHQAVASLSPSGITTIAGAPVARTFGTPPLLAADRVRPRAIAAMLDAAPESDTGEGDVDRFPDRPPGARTKEMETFRSPLMRRTSAESLSTSTGGAMLMNASADGAPASLERRLSRGAEERRIYAALAQYERGYERLDADAVRAVWPSLDTRALARAFGGLKGQDLEFSRCNVDMQTREATATCGGRATYVPRVGNQARRTQSREWTFQFRKIDENWLIVKAEAR